MNISPTPQQVFDTVLTHLRTQKVKSMSRNGLDCAYRGDNGLKCAVGCLIMDVEYFTSMETRSVEGLYRDGILPLRFHGMVPFLQEIQTAHDVHMSTCRDASLQAMESKMSEIATKHNLIYTSPAKEEMEECLTN